MKIKLFIIFLCSLLSIQYGISQTLTNKDTYFKLAETLKNSNTEEAINNYQKSLNHWTQKKDSLAIVRSLSALSKIYNNQTNYSKSYDSLWKALLIAEKIESKEWQAKINHDLAYLYSSYDREKEALKHYTLSLKINKELSKTNKDSKNYVLRNYLAISRFYRNQKKLEEAKIYLDSCSLIHNSLNKEKINHYIEAEHAIFMASHGKAAEGLKKIKKCQKYFEKHNKSYMIVIHHLLGKIYKQQNRLKQSKNSFLKSLKTLQEFKSHKNYELYNYTELANIFIKTKKYQKAYAFNNKAKILNERIFGSKSQNNKELFAVKDRYRIEKEKQTQLEQENKLQILEKQHSIHILKQVILLGSLVFLGLFSYLFIRNLRLKHKNEKVIINEKQKVALEKQKEIIELKNKELTSSALQLIEKEEFINQLEKKLSNTNEKTDLRTIRNMVRSATTNPANNWQEFEARFININQGFFEKLKSKYPNLGPTDLKVCSLIKLNFSSKEMSSLLGISIESVHTSRYRIRKKIGLERNDNLSDFINSI